MRRKWLLIAGLVLAMGIAGLTACTAENGTSGQNVASLPIYTQQQGIVVSGVGKVSAVPDLAILTLGVQAQEATVANAQSIASTAMNKIMAALTADGVAAKDVQTQVFNITQVTQYDNNTQKQVVIGYQVTNTVVAKIRDLTKVGAIIDDVATAGGDVTRINGLSFTIEDPTNYNNQARKLAMDDAKAKAAQLASGLGVGLGKANYTSESSYLPPVPVSIGFEKAAGAPSTPISVGESEVSVNVQVTFAIK